jgi:hypothetical protein
MGQTRMRLASLVRISKKGLGFLGGEKERGRSGFGAHRPKHLIIEGFRFNRAINTVSYRLTNPDPDDRESAHQIPSEGPSSALQAPSPKASFLDDMNPFPFERSNAMSTAGHLGKTYHVAESKGHQSILQPGQEDIHWMRGKDGAIRSGRGKPPP